MSSYRSAVLALAICAASLTVAACTAGITTATPPATRTATPSHSASVARSSPSPASSGRMIPVSGVGSFPVPAGAKVAENVAGPQGIIIFFSSVTPAAVSSFYATALPRAGYTISGNSVINMGGNTETIIQFSGHGYKGNIGALSNFSNSGVSVAGLGTKNVTTISLMPK